MPDNMLPDDNQVRDVVTAFYRMLMGYRREVTAQVYRALKGQNEQLSDLRGQVADLRNRVEILEVRQAGEERRIP